MCKQQPWLGYGNGKNCNSNYYCASQPAPFGVVSGCGISSSSLSTSRSSSTSSSLYCPQGNSWPDCPINTWSDAYCASLPSVCQRSSSSKTSSSSSSQSSSLYCPQGNSWPDCPINTWSDAYCKQNSS